MNQIFVKNGYVLHLSNGHQWSILFSDDSSSTINIMAKTMNLSHSYKITGFCTIFTRNVPNGSYITLTNLDEQLKLPEDGWDRKLINRVVFWTHPDVSYTICQLSPESESNLETLKIGDVLFTLYEYENKFKSIPIHAALIERDGSGVLLAAYGGVGKSTCCQRIPEPWHTLCDDESLIVYTSPSHYEVHPFPTWSNFTTNRPKRSWDVQHHVALKAIYFLEQANYDEAIRISDSEAASRIFNSSWQAYDRMLRQVDLKYQSSLKKDLFSNACELSKTVPSYILRVDLYGKFWEEIDRVLING